MTLNSVGDLAITHMLRGRSAETKQHVEKLAMELSTGLTTDTAAAVRHDFTALSGIERGFQMAQTYTNSAREAATFVGAAQVALGAVQGELEEVLSTVVPGANSSTQVVIDAVVAETEVRFRTIVSSLNQSVAGRSLFAGRETDVSALASAQVILDALEPVANASPTAADWQAALDTWFGPGGDFETIAYTGGDDPLNGFLVSEGERVQMETTASSQSIRDVLKSVLSVALLPATGFTGDMDEQQKVMVNAVADVANASGGVTLERSKIGAAEETIDLAQTRLAAEKSALGLARIDLLAVDPYETATRFEEANRQLESLYLITSRIARLSLSDYL